MNNFIPRFYSKAEMELLQESDLVFPFSDNDAIYIPKDHQYQLTPQYFLERGRNLEMEVEGNEPEKVKHFLEYLRRKVYLRIYNSNKSTRPQMNFLIAKRGIRGYSVYEYRQAFLEAMFIEGCYLLDNGDISSIAGVDLDTMQNMSADVIRNQDRDFHKDCIRALTTLGLNYYGKYNFQPQGSDW